MEPSRQTGAGRSHPAPQLRGPTPVPVDPMSTSSHRQRRRSQGRRAKRALTPTGRSHPQTRRYGAQLAPDRLGDRFCPMAPRRALTRPRRAAQKMSAGEASSAQTPVATPHAFACRTTPAAVASQDALSCIKLPRYRTVEARGPLPLVTIQRYQESGPGPNRQEAVTPQTGLTPRERP